MTLKTKEMSCPCTIFDDCYDLEASLAALMANLVISMALTIQANRRLLQNVSCWNVTEVMVFVDDNDLLTVIKMRTGTWRKMTLGLPSAKKQ